MISWGKQPKTMETTTGHSSHCLHPCCLLTSALDISKTFKSSTLLRGLTNDMDADLVSKPISQIPGEAPAIGPSPVSDDAHFNWTLQAASTPGNLGLQQLFRG